MDIKHRNNNRTNMPECHTLQTITNLLLVLTN